MGAIKILSSHYYDSLNIPSEYYREALDKHSIVAITDAKGLILDVNDKFIEISGYSRDELIGQNHRILNSGHHPQEFWQNMWRKIKSGQIFKADIKNRKKNGDYYWVDTTIYPITNKNNIIECFFAIRTDITERIKKLEEERDAHDKLLLLEERLQEASHDLKNHLHIMQTILMMYEKTKDNKYLERMKKCLNRSGDFVHEIASGGTSSDAIESNREQTIHNGEEFIENFIEYYQDEFKDKNIRFSLNLDIKNFYWELDPIVMSRVIGNLVRNSIEAIKNHSDPLIEIIVSGNRKNPSLTVRDSGKSIPKHIKSKIFIRGYTTKSNNNNGLGLYTSRKILENFGFSLILDDDKINTTFTIFKML